MSATPHTLALLQAKFLKELHEAGRITDAEYASVAKPPLPSLARLSKIQGKCLGCGSTDAHNFNRHLGLGKFASRGPGCDALKGMSEEQVTQVEYEQLAARLAAAEQCNETLRQQLHECQSGADAAMEVDAVILPFDDTPPVDEQTVERIVLHAWKNFQEPEDIVAEFLRTKHFAKPETRSIRLSADGVHYEALKKDGRNGQLEWKKRETVEKLAIETLKAIDSGYICPRASPTWRAKYAKRFTDDAANTTRWKEDLTRAVKAMLEKEA
jgi:hypothetical protein